MHPAPSVIIFTVLSGIGFGLFVWLGFGVPAVSGINAFYYYFVAYALAVGGLVASTFHLGNPKNAYKSFSQWKTSWLSREGWLAVATLLIFSVVAIANIFLERALPLAGYFAGAIAVVTIFATSMIYAQLKTIPRWNHRLVPVYFLVLAIAGGALLAGQSIEACVLLVLALVIQLALWAVGDQRFAEEGSTMESATGLGRIGKVRLFEPPHTGTNYLLHEMVYVIGRKHAHKIRLLTVFFLCIIPCAILLLLPASILTTALAAICHLIGAFMSRWLFFAQAEHVVGLYYGKR